MKKEICQCKTPTFRTNSCLSNSSPTKNEQNHSKLAYKQQLSKKEVTSVHETYNEQSLFIYLFIYTRLKNSSTTR